MDEHKFQDDVDYRLGLNTVVGTASITIIHSLLVLTYHPHMEQLCGC